ncbi:hypothetical protein QQF64_023706 [Cirrhinus molitorella]|uniref:Uncharacterized protein n=1 Tax=Cirrhinus molitorella TaxID=172907 RepID=A0ABR3NJ59_9TELE
MSRVMCPFGSLSEALHSRRGFISTRLSDKHKSRKTDLGDVEMQEESSSGVLFSFPSQSSLVHNGIQTLDGDNQRWFQFLSPYQ